MPLRRYRNIVIETSELVCATPGGILKFRDGATLTVAKEDAQAVIQGLTSDTAPIKDTTPGRTVVTHGIPTAPGQPAPADLAAIQAVTAQAPVLTPPAEVTQPEPVS